jgi:hypothetical protein
MNDRPIHHVCYIVGDLPKAVDQWVEATGADGFSVAGVDAFWPTASTPAARVPT